MPACLVLGVLVAPLEEDELRGALLVGLLVPPLEHAAGLGVEGLEAVVVEALEVGEEPDEDSRKLLKRNMY